MRLSFDRQVIYNMQTILETKSPKTKCPPRIVPVTKAIKNFKSCNRWIVESKSFKYTKVCTDQMGMKSTIVIFMPYLISPTHSLVLTNHCVALLANRFYGSPIIEKRLFRGYDSQTDALLFSDPLHSIS